MLATAATTEALLPCPVSSRYGYDYWQQLPGGAIALGGGRDQALEYEWTTSRDPTTLVQAYLEKLLRTQLKVKAPITHRWAANVSYSSSALPIFKQVRRNVWAIGGYSGTGNTIGALCGRAAARVACGEPSEFATLLSAQ